MSMPHPVRDRILRRTVIVEKHGRWTTTTTIVEDCGEGSAEIDLVLEEARADTDAMERTLRAAFAPFRRMFARMRSRS
jgi:hypothetical protein